MKTTINFVQEEARKAFIAQGINAIIYCGKLPKIVEMLIEAYPEIQQYQDRINHTIQVLQKTQDIDILHKACHEMDKSERTAMFGCQWELPCWIAHSLILDLAAGIDIFNPSATDLRKSTTMMVARVYCMSEEDLTAYIQKKEQTLPTSEEKLDPAPRPEAARIAGLHPSVKNLFDQGDADLDWAETMSELLWVYPTKEDWDKESPDQKAARIPLLHNFGMRGYLEMEVEIVKLY